MMRFFIGCAVLWCLPMGMGLTVAVCQDAKQNDKLFWIFLTTGKSTEDVDRESVQEMQRQHLANFKRLAEDGRLLSAGPLSDPRNVLRGIVIVRAAGRDQLNDMFDEDPYIRGGYMNIEATPMEIVQGTIRTRITPAGLDEFRIVVIETTGDNRQTSSSPTDEMSIKQLMQDDDVLLSVRLSEQNYGRVAVLIMKKIEEQTMARKIGGITGKLKTQVLPLFLGKGTLTAS